MVCLNSTSKSLTIQLTSNPAIDLDWTAHYATKTNTTFVEAETDGVVSSATPVTIVPAPTGTNIISIREITVYNPNNSVVTFLVKLVNGGDSRVIYRKNLEGLSSWSSLADSNDSTLYTSEEKTKLAEIAPGAEVNVNADWNAIDGDSVIQNKPTLGTASAENVEYFATAEQGVLAVSAVQPDELIETIDIKLSDNTSSVPTGTAIEYYTLRYNLTLQSVWFETPHESPTGSNAIVRILYNGVNIFTNPDALTILDGNNSVGALTPNTINLVAGGVLRFDITQVGSTNTGKGYRVTLQGVRNAQ